MHLKRQLSPAFCPVQLTLSSPEDRSIASQDVTLWGRPGILKLRACSKPVPGLLFLLGLPERAVIRDSLCRILKMSLAKCLDMASEKPVKCDFLFSSSKLLSSELNLTARIAYTCPCIVNSKCAQHFFVRLAVYFVVVSPEAVVFSTETLFLRTPGC